MNVKVPWWLLLLLAVVFSTGFIIYMERLSYEIYLSAETHDEALERIKAEGELRKAKNAKAAQAEAFSSE